MICHRAKLITCIPSLRSNIVKDFTIKLADRLGIKFIDTLYKTEALPQKSMENSAFQCQNAMESFHILDHSVRYENILLVDDIVDSRWTLTVCGDKLMEYGYPKVYPFALADTSHREV